MSGYWLFTLHLVDKWLCRLEARQVVSCNSNSGVLGDVSCSLRSTMLDDETAETTQIDIFLVFKHWFLDSLHETLHNYSNFSFLKSSCFHDLVYNVSFGHFLLVVLLCYFTYNPYWTCKYTSFLCIQEIYLPFFAKSMAFFFLNSLMFNKLRVKSGVSLLLCSIWQSFVFVNKYSLMWAGVLYIIIGIWNICV